MAYSLMVFHSNGTKEIIPIASENLTYAVIPGDNVQLVDENGRPVGARFLPDGFHLKLIHGDRLEVNLKHFYSHAGEVAPITITLEPEQADQSSAKTCLRLSNTGHINLVDSVCHELVEQTSDHLVFVDAGEPTTLTFTYFLNTPNHEATTETVTITIDGSENPSKESPHPSANMTSAPEIPTGPVSDFAFDPENKIEFLGPVEPATVTFTYFLNTPQGNAATETVTIKIPGLHDIVTVAHHAPGIDYAVDLNRKPSVRKNRQTCSLTAHGTLYYQRLYPVESPTVPC
jgi:hypothetical protein